MQANASETGADKTAKNYLERFSTTQRHIRRAARPGKKRAFCKIPGVSIKKDALDRVRETSNLAKTLTLRRA